MDSLFNGNVVFIFFFSMIAIFNYSNLKESQRITIMYITIYSLVATKGISVRMALLLLFLTMFFFLEILTKDEIKFKILVNPFYKIADCIYLSFSEYAVLEIILAVVLCGYRFTIFSDFVTVIIKIISLITLATAITITLQQKYVIKSFNEMYRVFQDFPIQKVEYNEKLNQACDILVSIEDRTYFERKGYTFLSFDAIKCIIKRKHELMTFFQKIKYTRNAGVNFVRHVLKEDRGYSTIPMQLIRSLGIECGYNYKYRRKVFEFLYARMFFNGIKKFYDEAMVSEKKNFKKYLLYIYFHTVNTFLGDAKFSKFLNAFDMQYDKPNKKDIYDFS